MPSPFPGMDPYLEAPDIWPDFHDRLAEQVSSVLNRTLPRPYYARLSMRPEVGIVGWENPRRIVPDIAVMRPHHAPTRLPSVGVAVMENPRTDLSPSLGMRIPNEPLRHHFVEIRDALRGHTLITLIEFASPTNKRPGPDRRAYEAKQQEILHSDTSLIEVDLLRAGEPLVGGPAVIGAVGELNIQADYLVGVSRGWQRGAELAYDLFPVLLQEPLPCIPVPLREGEPQVPLDVQYAFNLTYDSGPYARGAVDYDGPIAPPVRSELVEWIHTCLDRWRSRTSDSA